MNSYDAGDIVHGPACTFAMPANQPTGDTVEMAQSRGKRWYQRQVTDRIAPHVQEQTRQAAQQMKEQKDMDADKRRKLLEGSPVGRRIVMAEDQDARDRRAVEFSNPPIPDKLRKVLALTPLGQDVLKHRDAARARAGL